VKEIRLRKACAPRKTNSIPDRSLAEIVTALLRPKRGLPLEPSKKLMRILRQLVSSDDTPILDAPSGAGRNALALADQGHHVIAVDKDVKRLSVLKQSIADQPAAGKVSAICADLVDGRLPFGAFSFSAILCIHYPVQRIVLDLKAVLKRGGHLYIETFQGHGKNYLELPRAGEIFCALQDFEMLIYTERAVGPPGQQAVIVEALARKN
jgi:SAM-dependent methyltransferase